MEQDSTILVVDDQPVQREILEALLSQQEYSLTFASNGEEALAKAAELTPDLILLDVIMPGMDGFVVCRRLRSDSVLAKVPVVMITSLDDRESRLQGIEAGADNFINKPFDEIELLAQVRTIAGLNRYRQLLQEIRKQERDIDTLYNTASALNNIIDIDALLDFIIQQTKELLDVECASVILHDREKDELYFPVLATEEDAVTKRLEEIRFPTDSGIAGWVFQKGEAIMVQDVSADERFYQQVDEDTGFETRSILCIPLNGKDGRLGVFEAVNKKKGEFTEGDKSLLEAMADNIAVSIERANLYQDLQEIEALLKRQNTELAQTVVALKDEITERKQAERALRKAHGQLSEMQKQLIQSEKLAALGRFSTGITHEIKNPLAIILSGLDFLEIKLSKMDTEMEDTDINMAVDRIKKSAIRADDILRNLLKFARPSESDFEKVKPRDLIADTLSFFRYSAPSKNVDIATQFSEKEAHIKIDKLQIQQVLFNLLMNSLEAMPDGGEILVKGYELASSKEPPRYAIEISDTGEGISEDDLSKLFEPFYTTKRDNKGTGLGLSISRKIVDNHGGNLVIDSELRKGTTARVILPFVQGV